MSNPLSQLLIKNDMPGIRTATPVNQQHPGYIEEYKPTSGFFPTGEFLGQPVSADTQSLIGDMALFGLGPTGLRGLKDIPRIMRRGGKKYTGTSLLEQMLNKVSSKFPKELKNKLRTLFHTPGMSMNTPSGATSVAKVTNPPLALPYTPPPSINPTWRGGDLGLPSPMGGGLLGKFISPHGAQIGKQRSLLDYVGAESKLGQEILKKAYTR